MYSLVETFDETNLFLYLDAGLLRMKLLEQRDHIWSVGRIVDHAGASGPLGRSKTLDDVDCILDVSSLQIPKRTNVN